MTKQDLIYGMMTFVIMLVLSLVFCVIDSKDMELKDKGMTQVSPVDSLIIEWKQGKEKL